MDAGARSEAVLKYDDGTLTLSATDLAHHLACRHKSRLDLGFARGEIRADNWFDPNLRSLQERGLEHENEYIDHLRSSGVDVLDLREHDDARSLVERSRLAMAEGAGAIVQAGLEGGRWRGRTDVLLRVARPSDLGRWSYEVVDTKLATETRATAVLQLCLYSELVAEEQGAEPELVHVVSPGVDFVAESYRLSGLRAYYRYIKRRLVSAVDSGTAAETYPEPCDHCEICRWRWACDERRRRDDHLSLVAGITVRQRAELERRDVTTVASLAAEPVPLAWRPRRGSVESFERVREQARVQVEARESGRRVFELLPLDREHGFRLLPEPSPGDVFFDLEGSRFAVPGGLEYLFGYCTRDGVPIPDYWCAWALEPRDERAAFETFVDRLMACWKEDPGFHAYHFSPYDVAALKRLMGRYATREEEVDRLLRGGRFIDLAAVVRRSLRLGVESYSLKEVEPFAGYERQVDLLEAARHLRAVQRAVERRSSATLDRSSLERVELYNRDDCAALVQLQAWLEKLRSEQVVLGADLPRPALEGAEASAEVTAHMARVARLVERLTAGLPAEECDWTEGDRALHLLAGMLDYHRREKKATWWEYFHLRDATDEELFAARAGVAGLELVGEAEGGTARCPVHRYRYPEQDARLKVGNELHSGELEVGTIVRWNLGDRTVDVKKRMAAREVHPSSAFAFRDVGVAAVVESLLGLGEEVATVGMDVAGSRPVARNLLLRRSPLHGEPAGGRRCAGEGESTLDAARRWATTIGARVLPIQGPPGSGKTYTGARMACELARSGAKVGITANSHKVIRNFLHAVLEAAAEEGSTVRCGHKVGNEREKTEEIVPFEDNPPAARALAGGEIDVLGGTKWLWSRDELAGSVDVLFVDEAGQMALPDVLAASRAARGLVLLGDPQQLEQPLRGSHPDGCDVSALEHLLGGARTVRPDRGIFLEETYRLHPKICSFTSDVFYEERLRPRPGLERQALGGPVLSGAGLHFLPVEHSGNRSASDEEVAVIAGLIDALCDGRSAWTDREGTERRLTYDDVMVVAPYNDQVATLSHRLPRVRVGTVDKFQGREAPLVVYSLATSSPEEAPRGMEFLYSPSRLNVATSRARAACLLVGSPALFEPDCKTPRQAELANAFCRYLELAKVIDHRTGSRPAGPRTAEA